MGRRLDYEKRRFDCKAKITIIEEEEFRDRDAAARWLERAEEWEERVAKGKKRKKWTKS